MRFHLALLPFLALSLFLQSCGSHETIISLNKDGSGTITRINTIRLPEDKDDREKAEELWKQMRAKFPFNGSDAIKYGKGVTWGKSEEIKLNEIDKGARDTYHFENINDLNLSLAGKPTEPDSKNRVNFRYREGRLIITPPRPSKTGTIEDLVELGKKDYDPEDPDVLTAIGGFVMVTKSNLEGKKCKFRLVFPTGIIASDATFQEGNSITLLEVDCDELLKTPKGTGVLKKLIDKQEPQNLPESAKKLPGIKVEASRFVIVAIK